MLPGKRNMILTILFGTTLYFIDCKRTGSGSVGGIPQIFAIPALPPPPGIFRNPLGQP